MSSTFLTKQKGFQTSSGFLGRGKNVIFGRTWMFLSQPFSTIGLFPQFGANAVKNVHTIDQRAIFSVIGAISPKFSATSVTHFLCQSCVKQIDMFFSEPARRSIFTAFQRDAMSACSYLTGRSQSVSRNMGFGDKTNGIVQSMIRTGICCSQKGIDHYRIINGSLYNQLPGDRKLSYRCASFGATEFYSKFVPCFALRNRGFRLTCAIQYSTGAVQNILFNGVSQDEQLKSSVVVQQRYLDFAWLKQILNTPFM